ncbi:MAG: ferritin-like domain-containing protein [Pseudomonadota bacterium]
MKLFAACFEALNEPDPAKKCALSESLHRAWEAGEVEVDEREPLLQSIDKPGRPQKPLLVPPQQVPRRKISSAVGRAALLHAIAHIEFNAINLALDAAYRFRNMPCEFYGDWLKVASEEALHFRLVREHLYSLGHDYGDFPAHNGLWEMAVKTAHDPLVRMALVPRVLEARGRDAQPAIAGKFKSVQDERAVEILAVIERDEIGHVAIGSRWYLYLCHQRGLEPLQTFRELLKEYDAPPLKPPFNLAGRKAGGFSEEELDWLNSL